jgi:predicted amidohydrolase
MRPLTIAAGSIADIAFASLDHKLAHALVLVEFAAAAKADLLVLPELLNAYKPFGGPPPQCVTLQELTDQPWQKSMAPLLNHAVKHHLALALPIIYSDHGTPRNAFFLIESDGSVVGKYHKRKLPPPEAAKGVQPDTTPLIPFRGLKVAGAICFDVYFPEVFQSQADQGADLFLVPSLTPGGPYLDFYALHHSAPIVLAYPGMSRIISPLGHTLSQAGFNQETYRFGFAPPLALATLNFNSVSLFGDINQPRIRDIQLKYGSRTRITFDQPSVTFFLESLDPDLHIQSLISEFALIPRRAYFNKYR